MATESVAMPNVSGTCSTRSKPAAFTMAASSSLTFRGNLTYLLEDDLPDYGGGAFGLANAARVYPTLRYEDDVMAALVGADLVVHATEWMLYRELDPAAVGAVVRQRHVIYARNTLDPASWRAAGWTYRALGRPNA